MVNLLVESGYRVVALERGSDPKRRKNTPFHEQIEWIDGHLGDLLSIQKGMEDADYVIHAAALVSFRPSDRKKLMQVNYEGTANLANCALAAPKLKKLVHISSVASLSPGRSLPAEVNEKQGFNPDDDTSDYAHSKYLAELEIFRGVEEGLKAAMVNPTPLHTDGVSNSVHPSSPTPFPADDDSAFVDSLYSSPFICSYDTCCSFERLYDTLVQWCDDSPICGKSSHTPPTICRA